MTRLLSTASLIVMLSVAARAAPPQRVAADHVGDPLPDRALLRLGSLRFRHPSNVHELALSPDEKTIVTIGSELIAWDAATGKERWRADLRAHRIAHRALSVLALCNTPGAVELLKELADREPGSDLGRLARAALQRIRSEEGN